MDFNGYVDQVNSHLERLGVTSRPSRQAYLDAWNNQIPARKMAESYQRRHGKESEAHSEATG